MEARGVEARGVVLNGCGGKGCVEVGCGGKVWRRGVHLLHLGGEQIGDEDRLRLLELDALDQRDAHGALREGALHRVRVRVMGTVTVTVTVAVTVSAEAPRTE